MKKILAKILAGMLLFSLVLVKSSFAEPSYIIDSPTTGMMDYGAYDLNFRLFSEGGILTRLNFGIFKRVNLGFAWELNRVIGSQSVVVAPPSLSIKLKLFPGDLVLPAVALGYDNQGYYYNSDLSEYAQKERGVYLVFGREMFFPGFSLNLGANMNDFKNSKTYAFANININYDDKFMFLGEYDNVNTASDSRLNLGLRFAITGDLDITLAGRDLTSSTQNSERIILVNYRGIF